MNNFKTWLVAVGIGGVVGLVIRSFWPQIGVLGVWAISLLVVLLSLRISDILSVRQP